MTTYKIEDDFGPLPDGLYHFDGMFKQKEAKDKVVSVYMNASIEELLANQILSSMLHYAQTNNLVGEDDDYLHAHYVRLPAQVLNEVKLTNLMRDALNKDTFAWRLDKIQRTESLSTSGKILHYLHVKLRRVGISDLAGV